MRVLALVGWLGFAISLGSTCAAHRQTTRAIAALETRVASCEAARDRTRGSLTACQTTAAEQAVDCVTALTRERRTTAELARLWLQYLRLEER